MSRRPSILTAVIAAVVLLGAMPAGASPRVPRSASEELPEAAPRAQAPTERAFSISREDGNDTRGPLDLSSMKLTRGKRQDTISFTTIKPVSNAAIDPNNGNFAVLIDNNDNRKYDFAQYVFFARGKIRGLLYNLKTERTVDRTVPTSRTGPKAFRQVIERTRLQSPGTYRIALFSVYGAPPCAGTCTDAIPNRLPLIPLDHRAPTVSWDTEPSFFSGDAASDLTASIKFHFSDDRFGTGVKNWIAERQEVGSDTWELVGSGTILPPTVVVLGDEGKSYDVRFTVTDKQENRKISTTKRVTFPYDDRDGAIIYAGTSVQNTPADAFLQTATSLGQTSTATLPFTGTQVCLMGGPTANPAAAEFDVDTGAFTGTFAESTTTASREHFTCLDVPSGEHTILITATSVEPFVIDGFYVVP